MKLIFLIFSLLVTVNLEQSKSVNEEMVLTVNLTNIRVIEGDLRVGLYGREQEFLKDNDVYDHKIVEITDHEMKVEFIIQEAGEYAVAVLHDVNRNGKMDFNFIGFPKEPYAFSRNPGIWYRAPRFEECSFVVKSNSLINIKLK